MLSTRSSTTDMDLYENNLFYRHGYDMVRKSNLDQSRRLHTQEVKCFTKLWSLVDDKLKTNAMKDDDFEFVTRSQRPDMLRTLLVDQVTAGVADNAEDVLVLLREEYANTGMKTYNASLASYVERWRDPSSRIANAGLAYTEREMANRFVKGLIKRFSQLQADIMVEAPAARPQTIHASFVRAQKWKMRRRKFLGLLEKVQVVASGQLTLPSVVRKSRTVAVVAAGDLRKRLAATRKLLRRRLKQSLVVGGLMMGNLFAIFANALVI